MKKCDMCNQPAVVHETTVRSGITKEIHLCAECAHKQGVVIPGLYKTAELQHFAIAGPASVSRKPKSSRRLSCSQCGTTFAQFRRSGTLGCPACYQAFDTHLSRLIERAQAGATHHCGKSPSNAGTSIDRQARISKLMRELNSAVAAEQYERAAELRDALENLERSPSDRGTDASRASTEERSV